MSEPIRDMLQEALNGLTQEQLDEIAREDSEYKIRAAAIMENTKNFIDYPDTALVLHVASLMFHKAYEELGNDPEHRAGRIGLIYDLHDLADWFESHLRQEYAPPSADDKIN